MENTTKNWETSPEIITLLEMINRCEQSAIIGEKYGFSSSLKSARFSLNAEKKKIKDLEDELLKELEKELQRLS